MMDRVAARLAGEPLSKPRQRPETHWFARSGRCCRQGLPLVSYKCRFWNPSWKSPQSNNEVRFDFSGLNVRLFPRDDRLRVWEIPLLRSDIPMGLQKDVN